MFSHAKPIRMRNRLSRASGAAGAALRAREARLLDHEADLALAVDGDQRDLHGAQSRQGRMADLQEQLAQLEITGAAGGMVEVTLNGKGEARKFKIDPAAVNTEDTEMLEDLLLAAFNDAKSKQEQAMREKMSALTGGLPLPPGMALPF